MWQEIRHGTRTRTRKALRLREPLKSLCLCLRSRGHSPLCPPHGSSLHLTSLCLAFLTYKTEGMDRVYLKGVMYLCRSSLTWSAYKVCCLMNVQKTVHTVVGVDYSFCKPTLLFTQGNRRLNGHTQMSAPSSSGLSVCRLLILTVINNWLVSLNPNLKFSGKSPAWGRCVSLICQLLSAQGCHGGHSLIHGLPGKLLGKG